MYIGLIEQRINGLIGKPSWAWRFKKLHRYICERCGYEANVVFQAEEPFYCGGENCQHLIGIERAAETDASGIPMAILDALEVS